MSMSKKDYEYIAAALKHAREATMYSNEPLPLGGTESTHTPAVNRAIHDVAATLDRHNPRFNKGRFLRACGLEE